MNANTIKICGAFLVVNTLWHSRASFNDLYLQPSIFTHFSANGLFHVLPVPTTELSFLIVTVIYYLSALIFLFSFQKYSLLVFFLSGSIVDNIQVNFAAGGHSRYLQYATLLHTTLALFLNADSRIYIKSYRALVAAYYWVAGIYKYSVSGFRWALDESIYVHAVAVQVTTPIKQYVLEKFPRVFQFGAYAVYLAELFSPLIVFVRSSRWIILPILFLLHLLFPWVWGGHKDFVVNCVCLLICFADEPMAQKAIRKTEEFHGRISKLVFKRNFLP